MQQIPEARDAVSLERARTRLAHSSTQVGMDKLRKALCDPARLQIVEALSAGDICVSDLAMAIHRAPAATSQHLRVLRDLGLVDSRRRGTTMYYHLTEDSVTKHLEHVLHSLGATETKQSA